MDRTVQHAFDPQEIMAYLDGELEPQRAAALAGHLVDCAECQQVARNFRSVSERLLDFEIEPTPQRLSSAALEAMNSGNYSPKTIRAGNLYKGLSRWRSLFAKRYVLGFAGALAVVALLIVAIPKMFEPKVAPNRIVALSRSDSVASVFREEAAEQKERNGVPEPAPPPVGDVVGQAGGVAGGVVQPGGELQAPETVGPMIVQTASLSIVAKNYDEANGAIERLASQRGGYVEKLEARAADRQRARAVGILPDSSEATRCIPCGFAKARACGTRFTVERRSKRAVCGFASAAAQRASHRKAPDRTSGHSHRKTFGCAGRRTRASPDSGRNREHAGSKHGFSTPGKLRYGAGRAERGIPRASRRNIQWNENLERAGRRLRKLGGRSGGGPHLPAHLWSVDNLLAGDHIDPVMVGLEALPSARCSILKGQQSSKEHRNLTVTLSEIGDAARKSQILDSTNELSPVVT